MISRFSLAVAAGSIVVAAGLSAIYYSDARASAPMIATTLAEPVQTPTVAEGSATEPVGSAGSGSARPSDAIDDPVEKPGDALHDVQLAWSQNWALFCLALVIMVSRGLGTARKKWPTLKALHWLSGKTALVVYGVGFAAAAMFDAVALGGKWTSTLAVGVAAMLSLMNPQAKPTEGGATT